MKQRIKELTQKHKNKIVAASVIILAALFIFIVLYLFSSNRIQKKMEIEKKIDNAALQLFQNLDIKAKAFVVYDGTEGRLIYAKNGNAQLPLASLTKVMSVLIALDLAPKDSLIEVKSNSEFLKSNNKNALSPGQWKLVDMLSLILVSSSNIGINTIASELSARQQFVGGDAQFIRLMNTKARNLGLNQTFFLNASGLDINATLSGGYGSAIDMARLFEYALIKAPEVISSTKFNSIVINSAEGKSNAVENTNPDVSAIKGLVASKTGFTELAGGNLAIAFEVNSGRRVIVVVLGSTQNDRFTDTALLTHAAIAYYSIIKS